MCENKLGTETKNEIIIQSKYIFKLNISTQTKHNDNFYN